ncbi:MAG: hypothetical protein AABX59_02910 [Nanoarchaeota archaeon]
MKSQTVTQTQTKVKIEGKTGLPVYEARPLVDPVVPIVGFFGGEQGKEVLKEFQERAKADYNSAKALDILSYEDKLAKGSNPFAVVLLNQILRQEGLRTADQADLEEALRLNALPLKGHYEDTALVLRNDKESNKYLAEYLTAQVKERNPKIKMPVMTPLYGLELVNDQNSDYALSFKLRDDAEIIYAPILNKQGRFSSEDIDPGTGLPTKLGMGDRTLHTIQHGLSGLGLNRYLDVDSDWGNLANSSSDGRVVVVQEGGEATAQNLVGFNNILNAIQQGKIFKSPSGKVYVPLDPEVASEIQG